MKNYYRDDKYLIPFKSVVYVWFSFNYYTKVEIRVKNKEEYIGLTSGDAERFLIEYKEWLENE